MTSSVMSHLPKREMPMCTCGFSPESSNHLAVPVGHPIQLWSWPCYQQRRWPETPSNVPQLPAPCWHRRSSRQPTPATAQKRRCAILCPSSTTAPSKGFNPASTVTFPFQRQAPLMYTAYFAISAASVEDHVPLAQTPSQNGPGLTCCHSCFGHRTELVPTFLCKITFSRSINFAYHNVGEKNIERKSEHYKF